MTGSTALKTPSSEKKRKSTAKDKDNAKKPRLTLDTFFSPLVPKLVNKDDEGNHQVSLSDEQNKVLRTVCDEGKNVFFTGSAGTGKSLLLRAIIAALKRKHVKDPHAVSVTASTGMAASNIGGMTIHSWGAVSPTVQNVDVQISCIKTCKPALQRWKKTQVLIIDEVSMVDGQLFQMLSVLSESLRKKSDRPFGGIQLVVTGDFFQLPPVTKAGETPFFAFECAAWKTAIERTITLKQVFRQKDNRFVSLLNAMRLGAMPPEAFETFASLTRELAPSPTGIVATQLFALRTEVERANGTRLAALPGPVRAFVAVDTGKAVATRRAKLLESVLAMSRLELRVGAQVMLIKNADAPRGLVNGAVGRVLGFYTAREVGGEVRIGAHTKGIKFGDDGRTPVVAKRPGKEEKENLPSGSVKVTPGAKKEDGSKDQAKGNAKAKTPAKEEERFPLVEFSTPEGKANVLLVKDEFKVEDSEGNVLARRVQIPLVLAWAMSIHKSQGQTIERVKVDLGQVFEKGQSYVAISRATSLDGLQVLRFDPKKVMAHRKVVEWSKSLE